MIPDNLPYLLLNRDICLSNIQKMYAKAEKQGLIFRPHFKTHQSHTIGGWFKHIGVKQISVSSFQMAKYFASDGWIDITVAFPVLPNDVEIINSISDQITLNILFSSVQNFNCTANIISKKVNAFIELDTGHGRSGLHPDDTRSIALLVNLIQSHPNINLKGFLTHTGQTYSLKNPIEVEAIHRKTLTILTRIKAFWKDSIPDISISYGDTPSCSVSDDFWGIDEIRPGNFVFYDLMQTRIGSCKHNDIATALICPVVDVHYDRNEILIKGGAIHLSKEFIVQADGTKSYGAICPFDGVLWGEPFTSMYIDRLSQEHGVIKVNDADELIHFKVGQLLAVLPVHSCLTLDTMGELYLSDGTQISTMRERCFR